ncbi:MAG: metal-dependent hydrolase [Gammaproteobacteria bacterium]|nr:metal-dependent hydrolase [Gammaproteobacteria bacterium]NIP90621.1 metal-dependent hydrolase [Gammaproteobacteria bacterium]NIR25244.1 metal-dependent hydrolase [Gammaproteobacteria bacterium]NIS06939.1 metal-dependent hydrolase [Gammaproteobacteria bacterium]NIU41909.1 metal-dependent hydrolase [Gammaproteobacteria bacterium]
MDTITQIALGAAVGEATLGHKVGSRAILWGGICAALPDLDLLVPLGDVVRNFTYHRSASHSLIVLAALTPLMVWLILKAHPQTAAYRTRWYLLVYLAFATHVLLDCFTVFGTQVFWPIDNTPVAWSSVFIIDPAYSLPLMAGVLAALFMTRSRPTGHRLSWAGLVFSSAYLVFTLGAKLHVEQVARQSLAEQEIAYIRLLSTPSPFNALLWRVLIVEEGGYREGFYSLFDEKREIRMQSYSSQPQLLQGIEDHWPVKRLQWFTRGFYSVSRIGEDVVITDLRMGVEHSYVFRFKVGTTGNPHSNPAAAERLPSMRAPGRLKNVWIRIWNADTTI